MSTRKNLIRTLTSLDDVTIIFSVTACAYAPISVYYFCRKFVVGPPIVLGNIHLLLTPVERPRPISTLAVSARISTPSVPSKCGLRSMTTRPSSCRAQNELRMRTINLHLFLVVIVPLVLIVMPDRITAPLFLNLNRNKCNLCGCGERSVVLPAYAADHASSRPRG